MFLFRSLAIPIRSSKILLLIGILFLVACQSKKIVKTPELIEEHLLDSVWIPKRISDNAQYAFICPSGDSSIFYLDKYNSTYYTYNICDNKFVDSFYERGATKENYKQITSLSVNQEQNKYSVSRDNYLTIRYKNKKTKIYNLNKIIKKLDTNIRCSSLNPVQKIGPNFVVTACYFDYDKELKPSYNSVMHYYDIIFQIKNDSIVYLEKFNPNTTDIIKQDYNSNISRNRLLISPHTILYVYDYKDTIILYDFNQHTLIKKPIMTNNFVPNEPFNLDKFNDKKYKKEYSSSQSTFHSLMQNPKDSSVYIFLKHQDVYISKTGEKREYYDAAFSLLCYDKNLNFKKELKIPSKKYFLLAKFILNGKLYLSEYRYNPTQNGKAKYYIFSLTDNIRQ